MARCHIATGETDLALGDAERALEIAQHIGDSHSIWESRLLLAESHLKQGILMPASPSSMNCLNRALIRLPPSV